MEVGEREGSKGERIRGEGGRGGGGGGGGEGEGGEGRGNKRWKLVDTSSICLTQSVEGLWSVQIHQTEY